LCFLEESKYIRKTSTEKHRISNSYYYLLLIKPPPFSALKVAVDCHFQVLKIPVDKVPVTEKTQLYQIYVLAK